MTRSKLAIATAMLCALIALGCSGGGGNAVVPETGLHQTVTSANHGSQTHLWGYYDVFIDVEGNTVEAVLNRQAMFTANVVQFVNGKAANLAFKINGTPMGGDYVDVDIDVSITHPFPGMDEYNGYDVRGVFIGDATKSLAYNGDLRYAVLGLDQFVQDFNETADDLIFGNPDGYTRWFNPTEFKTAGLFGYTPGKVATPGYTGSATLNPYKYYADGLQKSDNLCDWLTANAGTNGVFSAGATNTRNYYLRFPNSKGVRYGYAIIANWEGAEVHPANAPEAVACTVDITDNVYYVDEGDNGGALILDASLFGWGAQPSTIFVESTVLSAVYEFTSSDMTPVGGGVNYSTYHVEIPADDVQGTDGNEFWVIAEYGDLDYSCDFGVPNLAGADALAAFFRYDLFVADTPYNKPPVCDLQVVTSMPAAWYESVDVEFDASGTSDPDGDVLTYEWDFDGDEVYGESPDDDYTGTETNPTHTYTADYVGDVNLRVTDPMETEDICTVAIDVTILDTDLYEYNGTTDGAGDLEVLEHHTGTNQTWAYVASQQAWDESNGAASYPAAYVTILATPEIDLPSGVTDIYFEISHWGRTEYEWDGGFIGYTTDDGANYTLNGPSPGSAFLSHDSGTNFNSGNRWYPPDYASQWNWNCDWMTDYPSIGWTNLYWCGGLGGGSAWGSQTAPVTSSWTCNSLAGTDDVRFCFVFCSDWLTASTGWSIRAVHVYVDP